VSGPDSVLVVHTGGTIGMVDTPYGSAERNLERFFKLPISSQERANIGGLNTLTLLGKQEGLR
jgi:L-asparaginase/Glu-tRNA(Gln) amidotransferase subunit D